MESAFNIRIYGTFIGIKSNIRRKNLIKRIKAPNVLDAALALETI